jgi:sugar fermentation stimulation protein A
VRYPRLIEGTLVRRYKRFLSDIELAGGEVVTAHCANPGAMTTCAIEGGRVWISTSDDPRRKLRYSWELAEVDGEMLSINTGRSNRVIEEALRARKIPELAGYREVKREIAVGDSRIDFVLEGAGKPRLVEVKTVTLWVGERAAAFPDSVTTRGRRHVEELIAARERGHRTALLFFCARTGIDRVRLAADIDPEYATAARRAAAAGVELVAYGCELDVERFEIGARLELELH